MAPAPGTFCALPGSVLATAHGLRMIPAPGTTTPDLSWLTIPVGFCAHWFGTEPMARQLRFLPHGDLLVASPTMQTTGGADDGVSGIVLMSDDNQDGVADSNILLVGGLPAVQGLMWSNDYLYYQDGPIIRRTPFHDGDRMAPGPSEVVTQMSVWPQDPLHWPKVLDTAADGTVYITNGSSQAESCQSSRPVRGAIVSLDADGGTTEVARGFRNPIALRCERDHDVCLAVELSLDYSDPQGGREKILQVRPGDDWGYPCCATKDVPYTGVVYTDTDQTPDCSGVVAESASFTIGDTPFGIDFETGLWPAPWTGRAFVTLHGTFASWNGARVVAVALDPATGLPLPASDLVSAPSSGSNLLGFASGWDDGRQDHGRPASIAFAPDGRLFIGDDQLGAIIWMAPLGLKSAPTTDAGEP